MSLKNPVAPPGIDPGTVRLVLQRLNHYATPGPNLSQDIIKSDVVKFAFYGVSRDLPSQYWNTLYSTVLSQYVMQYSPLTIRYAVQCLSQYVIQYSPLTIRYTVQCLSQYDIC
jgi:hypothetical protein